MKNLIIIFSILLISCAKDSSTKVYNNKLDELIAGNERFVAGKPERLHQDNEARIQSVKQQNPFAVIITCSDSRVSPSVIFDHGIGDLFIIRTAGNLLGEIELASVEYAVEHLGAEVILVMGHENCGAVSAYVNNNHERGHIQSIINTLKSEVEEKEAIKTHQLNTCILANIKHQTNYILKESEIIKDKIKNKKLQLASAEYSQKTGKITILEINK